MWAEKCCQRIRGGTGQCAKDVPEVWSLALEIPLVALQLIAEDVVRHVPALGILVRVERVLGAEGLLEHLGNRVPLVDLRFTLVPEEALEALDEALTVDAELEQSQEVT